MCAVCPKWHGSPPSNESRVEMAQFRHSRWAFARHAPCIANVAGARWGSKVFKDILLVGFATLAGFAASGIFANLYRLLADKPETTSGRIGYIAVMVVAGPNVLFENAATSFRAKACSSFAFWLAAAISAYWSFALGLLMIQVGLAI
jgi:hypothetical protein